MKRKFWGLCLVCLCMMLFVLPVQAKESNLEKATGKIVTSQVKNIKNEKKVLKKLFTYVEKNYGYQRTVGFNAYKGWEKTYAQEMINNKKGSCYHFAAIYAFLAKKATGEATRVCIGTTNGFNSAVWQPHAWCEVKVKGKWYVFDANMDKFAASSSGKYFYKLANSSQMKKTYKKTKTVKVAF